MNRNRTLHFERLWEYVKDTVDTSKAINNTLLAQLIYEYCEKNDIEIKEFCIDDRNPGIIKIKCNNDKFNSFYKELNTNSKYRLQYVKKIERLSTVHNNL